MMPRIRMVGAALAAVVVASTIAIAGCNRSSGDRPGPPVPPLVIDTQALPDATEGMAYTFTLIASGGVPPYSWNLAAGSLPGGLALVQAGEISGTPTASGSFPITVEVTDSRSPPASTTASLTLTVLTAAFPPEVTLCTLSGTQRGLVDLCYQLRDQDGNAVALAVEYSTDSGMTFQVATSGPGGEGTGPIQASPVATTHLYVWDSFANLGVILAPAVRLRVTPSDLLVGLPDETADFAVDNTPGSSLFIPANPMQTARMKHTMTLLPDGSVLVAGGQGAGQTILSSAEIFSLVTGRFTPVASQMMTPRAQHTASLLPDGRVLLAGGVSFVVGGSELDSAEVFDPATGSFTPTGLMADARVFHAATVGGGVAYITGGFISGLPTYIDRAEEFDPVLSTFAIVGGNFVESRAGHSAHYLPSGRILLAGGSELQWTLSAEEFDPASGTSPVQDVVALSMETIEHGSTLLQDGTVLVTGGGPSWAITGFANSFSQASVWTPGIGFTTVSPMNKTRRRHTSTQVPDGRVLITGGEENMTFAIMPDSETYDPAARSFTNTSPMTIGRYWHAAVLLTDGRVLITGGTPDGLDPVPETERFHP